MTVDHSFMIKKIQSMQKLYVLYSGLTSMPFVECDEETMEDKVHVFSNTGNAKAFCDEKMQEKCPLVIREVSGQEKLLAMYHEFYQNGISVVAYHDEVRENQIELEKIVTIPDWSQMEHKPVFNPLLQLTAAYFFQEVRKPDQKNDDPARLEKLRELEEEMQVNIARSTLLLPVLEKTETDENNQQKKQLGAVLMKNKNGDIFQPVFTDISEMAKIYPKVTAEFKVLSLPFAELVPRVLANSKGFVLNAAGFNLVLTRQLLIKIVRRFNVQLPRLDVVKAEPAAQQPSEQPTEAPKPEA